MTVIEKVDLKQLYEIDDYLWIQTTIKLLREKRFNELDLDNLIEELDDLGRERKNRVESLLKQIIRHLLLLEYWQEENQRNYAHWRSEIVAFRDQLNGWMSANLYNYLSENLDKIYSKSRKYVQEKSQLDIFPLQCPYTLDQLLDEDWFPNHNK